MSENETTDLGGEDKKKSADKSKTTIGYPERIGLTIRKLLDSNSLSEYYNMLTLFLIVILLFSAIGMAMGGLIAGFMLPIRWVWNLAL